MDKLWTFFHSEVILKKGSMEWEGEALKAREKGARVVVTRFGIVMGEKGGAFSQMIPLFKTYIGRPIGSGKQGFSWIHIKDLYTDIEKALQSIIE